MLLVGMVFLAIQLSAILLGPVIGWCVTESAPDTLPALRGISRRRCLHLSDFPGTNTLPGPDQRAMEKPSWFRGFSVSGQCFPLSAALDCSITGRVGKIGRRDPGIFGKHGGRSRDFSL
ncbi:hypothetical protein N7532_009225 [Penicillium argentinense]|uniref:Uncharacterized protein n=1 Tax=Penicillium argentinense TaxID=1131581 RepID=A0A9W9K2S5_9EURO|nr:uncharacterized protein N7532_009225 [Penicillium argentinense]KAJ5090541.1 hypothetical protein N7532_009225 [Penicillium argentinense]